MNHAVHSPDEADRTQGGSLERRAASPVRRTGRKGTGRRRGEGSQSERRELKDASKRVKQRAEVRNFVNRNRLEPFVMLLGRLATAAFGPAASVMPHLRKKRGRTTLVVVVDAAFPLANTHYEAFLPLERTFWETYNALPKPPVPFIVGVRPARGWSRAESLAPMFQEQQETDLLA